MTTRSEQKAAIESAIEWGGLLGRLGAPQVSILRAHLETFDEEREFLEAAMEWGGWYDRNFKTTDNWSVEEAQLVMAYRRLVAQREEK